MHPIIHANQTMRYFLLTILSLSLACTKQPSAPDTFSLSGTVHLEGQDDHSGVTAVLYALAETEVSGTIRQCMVWPSEHHFNAKGGEECATRHG